ncbi:MAG: nicotinate-nucleotide adenylyltransferase [Pseudomonadota bacterium]
MTNSPDTIREDDLKIPHAEADMVIGLLGGSFNPPHEGHLHISELALKRAKLDQVWWIVSPGNPLKDHSELASLGKRLRLCHDLARHPDIKITAFEARFNVRYTEHTLSILKKRRSRLKFVWLMGADNLAGFHKWRNWQGIAEMMPIIVIDRPGSTLSYLSAPAAIALSGYRVDETDVSRLAYMKPPAWTFLHGPRSLLSSTQIRRNRR